MKLPEQRKLWMESCVKAWTVIIKAYYPYTFRLTNERNKQAYF